MMMASVLLGAGRRLAAHGRFDLLGPRGRQISLLTAYAVGVIITGSWGLTTNVFTGCCCAFFDCCCLLTGATAGVAAAIAVAAVVWSVSLDQLDVQQRYSWDRFQVCNSWGKFTVCYSWGRFR